MRAGLSCALTQFNLLGNNTTDSSTLTPPTPRQVVKKIKLSRYLPRYREKGSRPLLAYIADLVAEAAGPGVSAAFQGTFSFLFSFFSPVSGTVKPQAFLGVCKPPERSKSLSF